MTAESIQPVSQPTQPVNPQPQRQPTHAPQHTSTTIILILIIVGFITTFLSGFYLAKLLATETKTGGGSTTKATPTPSPGTPTVQETTKFLPGKHYFDDTMILVTKDKPRRNLVATVTRVEQDSDYIQSTRASYFDGSQWIRLIENTTTPNSAIISDNIAKSWQIDIDPSRVLRQTVQGELTVHDTSLMFDSGALFNEIGMRSMPGYTKFVSNGVGTLTIDGVSHPAYVLYTQIYSLNASDIQFYDTPFGLTTDWIAFWDQAGNFYHIDATSVSKPTEIYQTHKIGIMETVQGAVYKTFDLDINKDNSNTPSNVPNEYSISLNNPIKTRLNIQRIDGINKAPNDAFTWYMGNIEGTVYQIDGKEIHGIGLIEYIHN